MSATKSIKVATATYDVLKQVAAEECMTLQAVLDKLVKDYENRKFFEAVNAAYLSMTPEEWEQELAERQEMDRLTEGEQQECNDEAW